MDIEHERFVAKHFRLVHAESEIFVVQLRVRINMSPMAMSVSDIMLSFTPPFFNEEKNPGPT